MYTESEAHERWCPLTRVIAYLEGGAGNRVVVQQQGHTDPDSKRMADATACVGAHCMAWRWVDGNARPVSERKGRCGMVTGSAFE